jgi:hypothetical protein
MREVAPLPPVEPPGPPSLVNAVVAFMIAVSLVTTWAVLCRSEATESDSVANFLGEHATPMDMTGFIPPTNRIGPDPYVDGGGVFWQCWNTFSSGAAATATNRRRSYCRIHSAPRAVTRGVQF